MQAIVLREKIVSAFFEGGSVALDIPELGQVAFELLPTGDFFEVVAGELILGGDPSKIKLA